jgi:hypothetical protein
MQTLSSDFKNTHQSRIIKAALLALVLVALFWLSFLALTAGLAVA